MTLASQINGMEHIALELTDLKEGIRFFRETLGFKERFRTTFDGFELVMLKAGPVEIEMWQLRDGEPAIDALTTTTVHHLAVGVKNLDKAMDAVRELGLPILVEPYAPTDGIREAIIQGPDGLRVQLTEKDLLKLIWRSLRGDFCS